MNKLPRIAIIGPGKVGTTVGIAAKQLGFNVVAVGGRSSDKTKQAAALISDTAVACSPAEAASKGNLIFLTVTDNAIEKVCSDLAKSKALNQGSAVIHFSGLLSSSILNSAKKLCSCSIGSAHPLQTFPIVESSIERLSQAYWFLEGDEKVLAFLNEFMTQLNASSIIIEPQHKALYHCAASIACNLFTTLVDVSLKTAAGANIDHHIAWQALKPLIETTINNIGHMGTEKSLTGPIARGDLDTVRLHISTLNHYDQNIEEIYRILSTWTVSLAARNGSIDTTTKRALLELLATKI